MYSSSLGGKKKGETGEGRERGEVSLDASSKIDRGSLGGRKYSQFSRREHVVVVLRSHGDGSCRESGHRLVGDDNEEEDPSTDFGFDRI